MSSLPEIMIAFRKLERARVTPRDAILMELIRQNPSINGSDLTYKAGLSERSAVQTNMPRLMDRGFIEDRRVKTGLRTPNILYITKKGEEFLDSLISQHDL